jgi:hypothetical protein
MALLVNSVPLSLTIVLGLPALAKELIELAGDPDARDRGIGDERQAFARAVVDHDQDAHATAINELVGHEVERPPVVRELRRDHRRPRSQGPLAPSSPADREALLAIEAE